MPVVQAEPTWLSLASPGPGRPLMGLVEGLARPLRAFATEVSTSLNVTPADFEQIWAPRAPNLGFVPPHDKVAARSRATWCLIGEWLAAYVLGAVESDATVADAHKWFTQGVGRGSIFVPAVRPQWFSGAPSRELVHALLPYLLDPASPATRRDVMKGRAHTRERAARKAAGAYFTPADLAHFMISGLDRHADTWLDPSCGTGVFMRAVLAAQSDASVFGIDLNPVSADLTPFTLMLEDHLVRERPPWITWHLHRLAVATGDALMLDTQSKPSRRPRELAAKRGGAMHQLLHGTLPGPARSAGAAGEASPWMLAETFPELWQGVESIVQNPPYAKPDADRLPAYERRWGRLPSNVYPLFVELGLNLLSPHGQLAAVVPSSLVSSHASPILRLRQVLADAGADIELLSYDRAPDGLFGDDVKTRCSILFLDRGASPRLRIGPMQRITAQTRREVLRRGAGIELPVSQLRSRMLPKLTTSADADLIAALSLASRSVRSVASDVVSQSVGDASDAVATVIVAPTAYNWLNVQRHTELAVHLGHTSRNPAHAIRVVDAEEADALYAVLSSRLTYWVWRVYGDGFHVSKSLFDLLPAWQDDEDVRHLAKLGVELWSQCIASPVISTNGGRTTVAFPPTAGSSDLLDEIDEATLRSIKLSAPPVNLKEWAREVAVAGRGSGTVQKATEVGAE